MFHDKIGDILGSVISGAGRILQETLPGAIPAGLNWLAARENSEAARDLAKVASGASGPAKVAQRAQRLTQTGGGTPLRFMPSKQNGNILAQLGIGSSTPPYQQASFVAPVAAAGGAIVRQLPGILAGLGGGELIEELFQNGGNGYRPNGGLQLAGNWGGLFTPSGNMRGTVGVIQPNGGITFARNVGQPVLYSRDATICKRVRSKSAKVAHAAGHRHSVTRRKW